MVWVPAGDQAVGCTPGQADCRPDETPHTVTLTRGVWVGATEVTRALWSAVMGERRWSSPDCGPTCPADGLRWLDAVQLANALSVREGLPACYEVTGEAVRWPDGLRCTGYRLPTEAEWEVAARAGGDLRYAGSDQAADVAWTAENAGGVPHPVGQLRPNGWGLSDLSGNVGEWVWDVYGRDAGDAVDPMGSAEGTDRVYRGGSVTFPRVAARVSRRDAGAPAWRVASVGVRLVRTGP
jgi:formylglycine-generating enzyme required for sulfatase activity